MTETSTQLQAVMQEAGAAMYQQSEAADAAAADQEPTADADDDVIEGEFEE